MTLSKAFEKLEPIILEYASIVISIRVAVDDKTITMQEAEAIQEHLAYLTSGANIIAWLIEQGVPNKEINSRNMYKYYKRLIPYIIENLKKEGK